jgi:hypothetical protein
VVVNCCAAYLNRQLSHVPGVGARPCGVILGVPLGRCRAPTWCLLWIASLCGPITREY